MPKPMDRSQAQHQGPQFIWWKHGVFYQIYPRSFQDSDDDGVGDLEGIIQRLDYLVDLGVDAIWISPIYPSPMADFGYDVSDYRDIHPLFGDLEIFDRLIDQAHRRNLRIVLDYVPNHTSDEHPWFIESRSSRENPKRDWYIWRDPATDGGPPNNWESFFGGPAWEFDKATGQYYLHLFLDKQPDLNWRNPEVIEAMQDVLRFWLNRGVDGFRMDVVTHLIKHPEMPDNPLVPQSTAGGETALVQEHRYDINQPEVHEQLRAFRRILDSYPGDRVAIGETWFFNPQELSTYYGENSDELQIPFNFILMTQAWNAAAMKRVISAYYASLPPGAAPNFVLGSHDEHRLASRYGFENHRSAGLLLLTLWGIPTLYYGDELGMHDVDIPVDRLQDPVGVRNPGAGIGRDPERTPMQWDPSSHAGFCPPEVEPWLPVSPDFEMVNASVESQDPNSTLNFYRHLLTLRRKMPALQYGDFTLLETPPDVLAYARSSGDQTVLAAINYQNQEHNLDFSVLGRKAELLLSTHFRRPGAVNLASVSLLPHEGILLEIEER